MPIFKGKVNKSHLHPICDRVIIKLSFWKGFTLTHADGILLVRFAIQSILYHSLFVYSWHTSLVKMIKNSYRNFIWYGNVSSRKLVIVDWKKMCQPRENDGLDLRLLIILNNATNLKFGWNLIKSDKNWAKVVQPRVLRRYGTIKHHFFLPFGIELNQSSTLSHPKLCGLLEMLVWLRFRKIIGVELLCCGKLKLLLWRSITLIQTC